LEAPAQPAKIVLVFSGLYRPHTAGVFSGERERAAAPRLRATVSGESNRAKSAAPG
jgi:hypothetical protein